MELWIKAHQGQDHIHATRKEGVSKRVSRGRCSGKDEEIARARPFSYAIEDRQGLY